MKILGIDISFRILLWNQAFFLGDANSIVPYLYLLYSLRMKLYSV